MSTSGHCHTYATASIGRDESSEAAGPALLTQIGAIDSDAKIQPCSILVNDVPLNRAPAVGHE
jgi:hypothetical protein